MPYGCPALEVLTSWASRTLTGRLIVRFTFFLRGGHISYWMDMEANHYLLLVAHKFVKINSGGGPFCVLSVCCTHSSDRLVEMAKNVKQLPAGQRFIRRAYLDIRK